MLCVGCSILRMREMRIHEITQNKYNNNQTEQYPVNINGNSHLLVLLCSSEAHLAHHQYISSSEFSALPVRVHLFNST